MSGDEKAGWVFVLWTFSIAATLGLGAAIYDDDFGGVSTFGVFFLILLWLWILRLAFVAGKQSNR